MFWIHEYHELNDIIFSFLNAYSLSQLFQTCKYFYQNDEVLSDKYWKNLCYKRWLYSSSFNIKRVFGCSNFKSCYRMIDFRKVPPKTIYTEKHRKVLGYSRVDGLYCWIYLNHTQDSKPRRRISNGKLQYFMTLRIFIQNNRHGLVSLTTQIIDSNIKVLSKDLIGDNNKILPLKSISLLDYSNKDKSFPKLTHEYDVISLRYLDYAILSIDIDCPSNTVNEVDFLCSILTVQVFPRIIISDSNRFKSSLVNLRCDIYDEEKLLDYYDELPGGVVLLKQIDKPF